MSSPYHFKSELKKEEKIHEINSKSCELDLCPFYRECVHILVCSPSEIVSRVECDNGIHSLLVFPFKNTTSPWPLIGLVVMAVNGGLSHQDWVISFMLSFVWVCPRGVSQLVWHLLLLGAAFPFLSLVLLCRWSTAPLPFCLLSDNSW